MPEPRAWNSNQNSCVGGLDPSPWAITAVPQGGLPNRRKLDLEAEPGLGPRNFSTACGHPNGFLPVRLNT